MITPGAFVKILSHCIINISVFVAGIDQELVSYQLQSLYQCMVNYNTMLWIWTPGLIYLMLRLKLQYFGHLMWRVDSLGKTLMLGGIGGRRRRGRQRMRWLDGITDSTELRSWWWTGRPGVLWFMGLQRVGHEWATELNWIELTEQHGSFWIRV